MFSAIAQQDWKKIRYTLQDFTTRYRRKNVGFGNSPLLATVPGC